MSSLTSIYQVGKEKESFKIIFCRKSSSHYLLNFMCLFNSSLVFPQNYKIKNSWDWQKELFCLNCPFLCESAKKYTVNFSSPSWSSLIFPSFTIHYISIHYFLPLRILTFCIITSFLSFQNYIFSNWIPCDCLLPVFLFCLYTFVSFLCMCQLGQITIICVLFASFWGS